MGTRALPAVAVAEFSPVGCVVQGDVRVELMHRDEEICHFWFHTAMLTRPRLVRHLAKDSPKCLLGQFKPLAHPS